MGGERLKNIVKKSRLPWALCVFIFLFSLNIPRIFAQSEGPEQGVADIQAVDPIVAAEQTLVLGENTVPAAGPTGSTPSFWVILRTLLVLVLAAAAIYGMVYLIKRFSRRTEVRNPYLKVLASTHLGSNRYVHVVSLGSKAWLVGAAENGVNLISEIDDKDILNVMFLDDSKKGTEQGRFPDFKTILGRLGVQVKPSPTGAENIRKRRERLKGW